MKCPALVNFTLEYPVAHGIAFTYIAGKYITLALASHRFIHIKACLLKWAMLD